MEKIKYGPENPDITYVPHGYDEHLFDTGEALINYATNGSPEKPAILLIPAITESWWGYEQAMGIFTLLDLQPKRRNRIIYQQKHSPHYNQ